MSDEVVATGIGPLASMDWPRVACLMADDFELLAPDLVGSLSLDEAGTGDRSGYCVGTDAAILAYYLRILNTKCTLFN